MVKESREAFNQHTSNSWLSQGQGSVVHLQGEFVSPELWEQIEEHFKKKVKQHQGQWPHKVQLSLNLGQVEVNHRTVPQHRKAPEKASDGKSFHCGISVYTELFFSPPARIPERGST